MKNNGSDEYISGNHGNLITYLYRWKVIKFWTPWPNSNWTQILTGFYLVPTNILTGFYLRSSIAFQFFYFETCVPLQHLEFFYFETCVPLQHLEVGSFLDFTTTYRPPNSLFARWQCLVNSNLLFLNLVDILQRLPYSIKTWDLSSLNFVMVLVDLI